MTPIKGNAMLGDLAKQTTPTYVAFNHVDSSEITPLIVWSALSQGRHQANRTVYMVCNAMTGLHSAEHSMGIVATRAIFLGVQRIAWGGE